MRKYGVALLLALLVMALALTACGGIRIERIPLDQRIADKCERYPQADMVPIGGIYYSCDDPAEDAAQAAETADATEAPSAEATAEAPASPAMDAPADCRNTDWFDAGVNPEGSTAIDVALIGTETCAATWRSANGEPVTAVCPDGWVCTFDVVGDIVRVYAGAGQQVQVRAATWRPEGNFCEILQGEINFANSQTPTFQVGPATGSPTCQ